MSQTDVELLPARTLRSGKVLDRRKSVSELPSALRDTNTRSTFASELPSLPSPQDSPALSRVSSRSNVALMSDGTTHESSLPPVDGGRPALTFLACAVLFEATVWGFGFSFSIFQDALPAVFPGSSTVEISAIGTIAMGFAYGTGVFLVPLYRRYPAAVLPTTYICFAIAVLSLLCSSWATSVSQLVLLQGCIYGLCSSVMYVPIVIYCYQWFSRRRNLAWGIICAGGAAGGFAVPLLLGSLMRHIGYANTIRAWSTFLGVAGSLALIGIKPRLPNPPKGAARPPLIPRDTQWLRSVLFWLVMTVVLFQSFAYFSISVFISPFTSSLGYQPFYAQLVLATFNAAGAVGQIGTGFFSDRKPYALVMFTTTSLSALLAFVLFGLASSLATVFVFVVLFGALSNGFSCAFPAASVDIAGTDPNSASLAFCFLALAKGLAGVLGPTIAGLLQTPTELRSVYGGYGYEGMIVFVGASMSVASVGAILTQMMHQKRARLGT